MIYTLTLNPSLDYVMSCNGVTRGAVNRSKSEYITFGGKGINVSAVLNEFGTENTAIILTAGFSGDELLKLLEKENIKVCPIRLSSGNTRINVKLKSDTETDINATGVCPSEEETKLLTDKIGNLTENDFLVLSGSIPSGMSADIYAHIAKNCKAKIAADCEGEPLLKLLPFNPYVIKPNLFELCSTLGITVKSDEDIKNALTELNRRGAQNILCSLGKDGAALYTSDKKFIKMNALKGEAINTTGAGDSMLAGYLYAVQNGADSTNCLKYGIAAGCATAFSKGLAKREDISLCATKLSAFPPL